MSKLRFIASTAIAALLAGVAGTASAKTVVTMNTVQIFGTIDPAKISDYTDYMAAVNLYDGLITVDSKGNLLPELASWTISPDAKEVTFKLRADAPFTDGTPVQAADVVYSFERLLKINQGARPISLPMSCKPGSIIAVDPKTVKFTLSRLSRPSLAPFRRSSSSTPTSSRRMPAVTTVRPIWRPIRLARGHTLSRSGIAAPP